MGFYKFIKIRGPEGARTGYFVPKMYHLGSIRIIMKVLGFSCVKERLMGWTFWWVNSEEDYIRAIETLNELKKTRLFDYMVSR